MKTVTNFVWKSLRAQTAVGLLLFLVLTTHSALAVTNYIFFSVNGDTSRNSIVQGDNVAWGANCDTGATLTWEIWFDLNSNSIIDSTVDRLVASFDIADGDTSSQGPPPDINPIPDGWYISPPIILGVAPGQYIFRVTSHSDHSSAHRALGCTPLPSPPNMFRGRVTVLGHPAPDSLYLRNIWIEADPEHGGMEIWSGLTDDNGLYQINVGAVGSGVEFRIKPNDIPGFVSPGSQLRTASGIVDSVNFFYSPPADSLYGQVIDQHGSLLNIQADIYCSPNFPGPSQKDTQLMNGAYKFYFGQSEYGIWNVGLNSNDLIPNYLSPSGFNFDNSVFHSLRHDFICYSADTVIYVRMTEAGNNPNHQYMIQANSNNLQAWTNAISNIGPDNLVTLHISSLDSSGWCVNVANWNDQYPIPPGYILDGRSQTCNRQPGDTVSLNFVFGKMVQDTLRLDPGDPPITWSNIWMNLFSLNGSYGTQVDNNGVFTIYADTGTYTLNTNQGQYLSDPFSRTLHLTCDTTGGLGFTMNEAHCHVTGTLMNIPLPLPFTPSINAHTADGNNGYLTWAMVDSVTGLYSIMLCDGVWTLDPPYIPNRTIPFPMQLTISERPDTSRIANFIYVDPSGIGNSSGPLPSTYSLSQNYPNPFNAQTTIEYSLPAASHVKLEIYDLLGRRVETLLDKQQQAGYYQIIWNAGNQPSGIYFYKIKAGEFNDQKKLTLLK